MFLAGMGLAAASVGGALSTHATRATGPPTKQCCQFLHGKEADLVVEVFAGSYAEGAEFLAKNSIYGRSLSGSGNTSATRPLTPLLRLLQGNFDKAATQLELELVEWCFRSWSGALASL